MGPTGTTSSTTDALEGVERESGLLCPSPSPHRSWTSMDPPGSGPGGGPPRCCPDRSGAARATSATGALGELLRSEAAGAGGVPTGKRHPPGPTPDRRLAEALRDDLWPTPGNSPPQGGRGTAHLTSAGSGICSRWSSPGIRRIWGPGSRAGRLRTHRRGGPRPPFPPYPLSCSWRRPSGRDTADPPTNSTESARTDLQCCPGDGLHRQRRHGEARGGPDFRKTIPYPSPSRRSSTRWRRWCAMRM